MAKSAKANSALVSKIIGRSSLKFIDTLDESVVFNNKDTIRTPVPALNIALGGDLFTGFQSGLTILAGPSKHYKSMLGLRIVSAFLKKYEDAACLFIDSEFGITPAYLKANGVDPTRVVHAPVEHIEQMKFEAVNQLNELAREDKLIIFVDSLGNCPSKKELNDALEEKEKVDMSRAKSIKSLFRMVTPLLNIKDVPMTVINHVYEEQGLFPKMIMSGGSGPYLSADTIFFISRSQEKEGTDVVGYNFNLRVEKSRFTKEKSVIPINVTWEGGLNAFSGLFNMAKECGIIAEESKGWYNLVDISTGEVLTEKKIQKSKIDKDMYIKILKMPAFAEYVKETYQIPPQNLDEELQNELEDVMNG